MAGTFAQSKQLVKESWAILKQDKELVAIPIIATICSTIVLVLFAVAGYFLQLRYGLENPGQPIYYLLVFVYYLAAYFVVAFFSAVLVTCVSIRMKGGNPTLKQGIDNAMAHLGTLLLWSLVSATVGVILRLISERAGIFGRIGVWIVGVVWSLATFFIIPVLVLENLSVGQGIKRSKEIFLKTWGQNVVGGIGMGLFFGLLFLGVLVVAVGAIIAVSNLAHPLIPMIIIGALFAIFTVILAIISSTLSNIFHVALYNFAANGAAPAGISPELIQGAFKPKR